MRCRDKLDLCDTRYSIFMLILYLPRKVVTFKGFMDSLAEGFKLMVPAVTILIFAWSLKGMGDALGLAEFVGEL